MNEVILFLRSLGNLLATGALYGSDHPAVRQGLETAFSDLSSLVGEHGDVALSFLEDEIVVNEKPLHDMRGWAWSERLSRAGIQRIEFAAAATATEFEGFVSELAQELELAHDSFEHAPHPNIRCGVIGVRSMAGAVKDAVAALAYAAEDTDQTPLALGEESEAIEWIHETTRTTDSIPVPETAAVVRGLSVAAHDARPLMAPLLELKYTDQYTTAHCINVAILSMTLAEFLEFAHYEVHTIGEAALLHDIGKTRVPLEVTNKAGRLTEEERAIIEQHPTEGARILLSSSYRHETAAVVAYEHHMHWNGDGGYPKRGFQRTPHAYSRLVQVCDVFDALRTRRPFRPPVCYEAALMFLERGAGSQFDPNMVVAFAQMMREWNPRTVSKEEVESGAPAGELTVEDLDIIRANKFDADTETSSEATPEAA
jgi:putative nucleotidyltransferase with HDIG domain